MSHQNLKWSTAWQSCSHVELYYMTTINTLLWIEKSETWANENLYPKLTTHPSSALPVWRPLCTLSWFIRLRISIPSSCRSLTIIPPTSVVLVLVLILVPVVSLISHITVISGSIRSFSLKDHRLNPLQIRLWNISYRPFGSIHPSKCDGYPKRCLKKIEVESSQQHKWGGEK